MRILRSIVLPLLLFALVFALFAPSIHYGFVNFDDFSYVVGNRLVHPGLTLSSIRGAFVSPPSDVGMFMPLLWISYMVDVTFFGASIDNPSPFHAVNVALHAANAVLFFFLLRHLVALLVPPSPPKSGARHQGTGPFPIFLLALLWALHPLRVESVAWVTERKDTLSLFFALLACLSYLRANGASGVSRTTAQSPGSAKFRILFAPLSLLLFAAALLAKPTLVPFPFLLILLDHLVLRRPLSLRLVLSKIHWFVLSAAAAMATFVGHRLPPNSISIPIRLARIPQTLAHYVHLLLFPSRLTPLDPRPDFALIPTVLDTVLLVFLLWAALRLARRIPAITLGIFWFFLFLIPVSGLVVVPNNMVADRFSYVPALGVSVALLPLFDPRFVPSAAARRLALVFAALLLPLLAALSLHQLPHWRSSDTLFARVRRFAPRNHFVALHDAHAVIAAAGDFQTALETVLSSCGTTPLSAQLVGVLADCIANLEGPLPAIDFLSAHPADSGPLRAAWSWQLAHLSLRAARPADAIAYADVAETQLSSFNTLHANIRRLRIAAAVAPDSPEALPHYISQWMIYERADALEFFRRFVAANPSRPDILSNVAWILATADWSPAPPSEALDYASRALALSPAPSPELLGIYAAALANAADFPAAVVAQEQALSILPPTSPDRPAVLSRLSLYRQAIPFRDDPGLVK